MRARPERGRSRAPAWGVAVVALMVVAAGCTGGEEAASPSGGSATTPPAAPVGSGWDVVVAGAHTESALPGSGGTFRANAGEVFLVVDLVVKPPEDAGGFAASEATLITGDGERLPARGGGSEGVYCVGCDFRATVRSGDIDASVVFVLPGSAPLEGLRLQVGDLDPVGIVVRTGDST